MGDCQQASLQIWDWVVEEEMSKKRRKLSEDEKLARWGKRLQKVADKALAQGRISFVDYRDISFHALLAVRPRECVKVTGL